eukprot:31135-Pelagococcus_subviridis.AAC.22
MGTSRLGDQRLDRDVAQLEIQANLAREDDHLPRDVRAAEVVARVGLRVPELLRLLYDVGEGVAVGVRVEDVGQRPGEDPLDLFHAVAGVDEVAHGGDDRQPGADGALVKVVRVPVARDRSELLVIIQRPAVRFFVRGDDVDAALEPLLVVRRHLLGRGAVDDDLVRRPGVDDVLRERGHVHRRRARLVILLPRVQVQRDVVVAGEEHLRDARDADDSEVDAEVRLELGELLLHLSEERLPDEPGADEADGHDRLAEVEAAVHRVQRLGDVVLVHDDGDVVLGRALRDRDDVHRGRRERFEDARGDAADLAHVLADHGENRAVSHRGDFLDPPRRDGLLEAFRERGDGSVGVVRPHREADRVLRGRLRDHHDVAVRLLHGLEHRVRGPGDADHPGPLDVDQAHVVDGGEAFDEARVLRAAADDVGVDGASVENRRSRRGLVEIVPQDDRDGVPHRRERRPRVQHVRAKVRQLPRFVVRERVEADGFFDFPRIRRVHAVDVRPDRDLRRDEHRAEDGRGVIASVPLQRRRDAVGRARDEPGGDENPPRALLAVPAVVENLIQVRVRPFVIDVHAAIFRVGDDQNVPRVDPLRVVALASNRRRAQPRGPELPVPDDEIGEGLRRRPGD